MSRKTIKLLITNGMQEVLMGCFSIASLSELQVKQNEGFQIAGIKQGHIEVVLENSDDPPDPQRGPDGLTEGQRQNNLHAALGSNKHFHTKPMGAHSHEREIGHC